MAMELIILINYTCAFPAKCEKELQKNKKNVFTDLFAISITTTLKNVALSGAFNTRIKSVIIKSAMLRVDTVCSNIMLSIMNTCKSSTRLTPTAYLP